MIVYEGLKTDFLKSVENDTIANEVEQKILENIGRHTSQSEFRSWINSLNYMYKVLNDPEIPCESGIAIEYNIPQTSKRVDFMISGYDNKYKPSVVIVELKQWNKIDVVDSVDALVETYTGGCIRRVVHPSYQAWSYAQLIQDYNINVQTQDITLAPCSYLHNYIRGINDPIDADFYIPHTRRAPAFTRGQGGDLRAFIKKYVNIGDKKEILYRIENGKIRPSKRLQDAISSMLKGNKEFTMIDEQKIVYERILEISKRCQLDGKKRTVICQGGPGTGKSVIAINLLSELTNLGQVAQYVSKNSAPRQVYKEKLKGEIKVSSIDNLFKGSGSYVDTKLNVFNTLLVDEAHRLNEKSGVYHNEGENQIKEIIHSSLCSVFFIDEAQRVTIEDIGSVVAIEKMAALEGSQIVKTVSDMTNSENLVLKSQFRCDGSDGYLAWLDNLLQIRDTANYTLQGLDYFVKVCSTPEELFSCILTKNKLENKSRVLAGYCWDWPKSERSDPEYCDIRIGSFGISWNLDNGRAFATDPNSVYQAGCIHTTQGLEFDYVGVIIGDDLRFENGKVVTDFSKRAKTDTSLKGIKTLFKTNPQEAQRTADEIIKNTYRTLLTRGMKGCFIYCTDSKLAEYIRTMLPTNSKQEYTLQGVAHEIAADNL